MTGVEPLQAAVDYRPSVQTLHLGLFGLMTVAALALGIWIRRTRRTRGANLFAATLLLLALRTGSDVVQGLVGELWTLQTVLVAVNPLLELCTLAVFVRFAVRYAGVERLDDRRLTQGLAGLVAVTAVAVATNPLHSLVFTTVRRTTPFTYVGVQPGVLGVAISAVTVAVLLAGAGLLAHAFTGGARPAWWPAALLSLGVSQAVLVRGLEFAGHGLLPLYDYGAIGLGAFVLLTTLALLDHGLRRIEVVAREAILDEIDDAVVFLDEDGAVVDYNPAAARLFPDAAVGEPFTDRFDGADGVLLGGGTSGAEVTLDEPAAGTRGGSTERVSPGSEATPLQGTDSQRWPRDFLVHTTRVTADTAELLGYAVRLVDVTDLKRRTRELQQKNEQLDQFASTVSHDLRNPLNVASGYVELAAESVDGADESEPVDVAATLGYLADVGVSLDRMGVIIEDILALTEHTDPVTETEPVEFEAVATAAWESVDTASGTLDLESGGTIEADRDRLQRLLENLFRNAVEHGSTSRHSSATRDDAVAHGSTSPPSDAQEDAVEHGSTSPAPEPQQDAGDHVGGDVAIRAGLDGSSFYVADDGPGIPAEDRDRVFEHGYTTGDGGTGLGLSIVSQLADAHGWEAGLDPDHDGACIVVSGVETDHEPTTPDA